LSRQSEGEFTGTLCETAVVLSTTNSPAHCERANFCRPVQIDSRFPSEVVLPLSGLLVRIIQKRLLANIPAPAYVSDILSGSDANEKGEGTQVPESEELSLDLHGVNEGSATVPNNAVQGPSEPVNGATFVLSKVASRSEALAALSEEMLRKDHVRKLRNRASARKSNKKRGEMFNKVAADVGSQRKMIASLKQREDRLLAENKLFNEIVSRYFARAASEVVMIFVSVMIALAATCFLLKDNSAGGYRPMRMCPTRVRPYFTNFVRALRACDRCCNLLKRDARRSLSARCILRGECYFAVGPRESRKAQRLFHDVNNVSDSVSRKMESSISKLN
jgi:hypothetical protein